MCPTFTFFATGEAISSVGATPIFVDSESRGFNICAVDMERKILSLTSSERSRLKAVIAVDLFGLPASYPEIMSVARKYGLYLIEDAAQGFGGRVGDRRAGSFGDVATTSFFPAKPLGCYGDGGAVFTSDREIASVLRSLRVHGQGAHKYDNVRIGMNSRLDNIQAAILLCKMKVFDGSSFRDKWLLRLIEHHFLQLLKCLEYRRAITVPGLNSPLFLIGAKRLNGRSKRSDCHGGCITKNAYINSWHLRVHRQMTRLFPNATRYANEVLCPPMRMRTLIQCL